tara:strand:- start:2118 stop:3488 length:1371 start_codon:yes stop_codon:yes gene_type:complete
MTAQVIARTGRVQSWIDNPDSRLPVSCTVFVVDDSMEGDEGIEKSWRYVSFALRHGAGVAVHLSKLRPRGTENGKGLVASGPVSFAKIYSVLNETLRRGGVYKNGAVVIHLDINHPDIVEFLTTPRHELPWVKRCVDLDDEKWKGTDKETRDAIIYGIKSGDIWLNKIKHDENGNRIYGNVCLEVYLRSRGTCLLQHINLGACTIGNIQEACFTGMSELCDLHGRTGVGGTGEYLPPETDRQVGLGFLGLANLLRRYRISYREFGEALDQFNNGLAPAGNSGHLAAELYKGIQLAAQCARANKMDRAFAIAPTASCSYRSQDLDGYTCTPEIAPPIARSVDRDSATFGVQSYDYGNVEIASEVGWDAYKKVADGFMTMLYRTGLLHGYSFNSWSDVVEYDNAFVEEWLASPQTSLYYSLQVMGNTQDKSNAYAALEDAEADAYLEEILSPQCECGE